MSTKLERYVWVTIAVAVLLVGALAALPTVAEAQAEAQEEEEDTSGDTRQAEQSAYESNDPAAKHRVVEPGDSLWAIVQERLGPNASPQQVANDVERIYWLNRDRIGDNPNLLAEGQELSLAPLSSPSGDIPQTEPVVVAGPPVAATEEQPATQEQPTEPGPGVEDTGEPKEQGASTAVASSLPEPYNAQHQQRRLLGLGVLALTLLLAILAALRLPLRRSVGRSQPRATSQAYANRQASGVGRLGAALAVGGPRKKILRGRAPGAKRLPPPRKLGAAPVYSPQVRRSLRRAQRLESREKAAVTSHPGALVIGLALSLAVLTGLPSTAEAQDVASEHHARTANQTAYETTAQPDPPDRLVVHPGDSLWSIVQERLGPNASPGLIDHEVGRIFELNRQRIGDDPDLILPGQELSLASLVQGTEHATDASATEFTATTAEEPARLEPNEEPALEPAVSEPAVEQPAEDEPAARNVEPSYTESADVDDRRLPDALTLLFSSGLFVFALAVATFGAWKLLRVRRLLIERPEASFRHDRSGHYGVGYYDQPQRSEWEEDEPAASAQASAPTANGSRPSKSR